MKRAALMLILCLPLAACLASGPAAGAPSGRQGRVAAAGAYPVKTDSGFLFGGRRGVPHNCGAPAEAMLKGAPLTQAVVDAWPKQYFADVAVMQAALAGVAWPQEVAYLQDCLGVTVTGPQVPGQMPPPAAAPRQVIWSEAPF